MGKITVNASRNVVSTHRVNVCTALISIKYVLQFYYHSSVLGMSFWRPKNKNKSLCMTWEDDSLGARDETGVSWSNWGLLPTFPRPCSAREFLITGHIFPGYVDLAGQLGQRALWPGLDLWALRRDTPERSYMVLFCCASPQYCSGSRPFCSQRLAALIHSMIWGLDLIISFSHTLSFSPS